MFSRGQSWPRGQMSCVSDRTPAVTLARSLLNSFQQRRRHCANTSTPLLPDDVPETDADPQSLDGLCGGRRR